MESNNSPDITTQRNTKIQKIQKNVGATMTISDGTTPPNATVFQVANTFIQRGIKEGNLSSHTKLQKLVYLVYGWHLGIYAKAPFTDAHPYAWEWGPVFPELYTRLKYSPISGIEEMIEDAGIVSEEIALGVLIDVVWQTYSKYSANTLSTLTHNEGTPWYDTLDGRNPVDIDIRPRMPDDIIRKHYESRLSQ